MCLSCTQPSTQYKGVSWVGSPYKVTEKDMKPIANIGVNWIVQTPFGWQESFNSPQIKLSTAGKYYWGETDEGIRVTHQHAKAYGIKTLLKPHLWLRGNGKGKWRSDIEMNSEEEWDLWFQSYTQFISHYATLAETYKIEALCIGTELHQTVVKKPEKWRTLIKHLRSIYSGKLTYAANWYKEYEEITFWDQLDFIGIQGYFPLSHSPSPSEKDLIEAWKIHLPKIESVSKAFNKKIVFTELGYKSTTDGAQKPWEWPEHNENLVLNIDTQTRSYHAFFKTFWNKPWFDGVFFWKWFPNHSVSGGTENKGFTPQNKPAQIVIKQYFTGKQ